MYKHGKYQGLEQKTQETQIFCSKDSSGPPDSSPIRYAPWLCSTPKACDLRKSCPEIEPGDPRNFMAFRWDFIVV
jgi:hypothetical protein